MSTFTINSETWDDAYEPESFDEKISPANVTWDPALTLLFHPDYARIGDRVALPELLFGEAIEVSRTTPEFTSPSETWGDPLGDAGISRQPFRLEGQEQGSVRIDCRQCPTRIEVDGMHVPKEICVTRAQVKAGVVLQLAERIVMLLHLIPPIGEEITDSLGMVGESAGIRRVRAEIKRIADLDVTVFLRGETGTGKELAAQALHRTSARYRQQMVSVNLGALPTGVANSALFGAVRGAFTGAVRDQEGYFKAAHKGTLFLDEIGETSQDIQAMLLRVLETGEIYPVGSNTALKVDTRIVAATDADLEKLVGNGVFKAPLLHRLAGYEIWLPPLRERRDDIGRLLYFFAEVELAKIGESEKLSIVKNSKTPWLPARIAARLALYPWPGNIRQFQNIVRQLVIGSRGLPQMTVPQAVERLLRGTEGLSAIGTGTGNIPVIRKLKKHRKPTTVIEVELEEALENNAWNLKATADALDISRPSLYALIKKHDGLRTSADLNESEIRTAFVEHAGDLARMAEALKVSSHALNRRLFEMGLLATQ